jgi:hypothetical protein
VPVFEAVPKRSPQATYDAPSAAAIVASSALFVETPMKKCGGTILLTSARGRSF